MSPSVSIVGPQTPLALRNTALVSLHSRWATHWATVNSPCCALSPSKRVSFRAWSVFVFGLGRGASHLTSRAQSTSEPIRPPQRLQLAWQIATSLHNKACFATFALHSDCIIHRLFIPYLAAICSLPRNGRAQSWRKVLAACHLREQTDAAPGEPTGGASWVMCIRYCSKRLFLVPVRAPILARR
jgi:hypothetical protein